MYFPTYQSEMKDILDKAVSGYTEPKVLKLIPENGKIAFAADKDDIVMIKAPAPLLWGTNLIVAIVGGAALVIMLAALIIPALRKKSGKNEEKTE